MPETAIAGWDVGGAHLKVARLDGDGRMKTVMQLPCPLWQGMKHLEAAVAEALGRLGPIGLSAVTMTGEMTDLFESRGEGVRRLIETMQRTLPDGEILVYAGDAGFLPPGKAVLRPERVASANWLASATFAAKSRSQGLFMDIGSTTSDIVPFRDGKVAARGYTDHERLIRCELVYTGVTRTPVFAVAERVPFRGEDQPLIPELFATMADVHRLCGRLPEDADQLPAADNKGKGEADSARRLARMLGRDVETAETAEWKRLARHLAGAQRRRLHAACERVLAPGLLDDDAPLVGAGIGRFLVRDLARGLDRPYVDFGSLVRGGKGAREWAARCAPAAAVALLAAGRG